MIPVDFAWPRRSPLRLDLILARATEWLTNAALILLLAVIVAQSFIGFFSWPETTTAIAARDIQAADQENPPWEK